MEQSSPLFRRGDAPIVKHPFMPQTDRMHIHPVTLTGRFVRLEPLSLEHLDPLCTVGLDPELWHFTMTLIRTPDDLRVYVETALRDQASGTALPFAIVELTSGRVVGSTRYGAIERAHRRVEIGWTWVARPWQRTVVNTEAKFLLLRHAFEVLRCRRVEFKTDALNAASRAALRRIGATEEGVFRNHMITPDGRHRNSVYFSIIEEEWPEVKVMLEEKLAHGRRV